MRKFIFGAALLAVAALAGAQTYQHRGHTTNHSTYSGQRGYSHSGIYGRSGSYGTYQHRYTSGSSNAYGIRHNYGSGYSGGHYSSTYGHGGNYGSTYGRRGTYGNSYNRTYTNRYGGNTYNRYGNTYNRTYANRYGNTYGHNYYGGRYGHNYGYGSYSGRYGMHSGGYYRPYGEGHRLSWFHERRWHYGPAYVTPAYSIYPGYTWGSMPLDAVLCWVYDPNTGEYYEAYYYPQYGYYAWYNNPLVAVGIYNPHFSIVIGG